MEVDVRPPGWCHAVPPSQTSPIPQPQRGKLGQAGDHEWGQTQPGCPQLLLKASGPLVKGQGGVGFRDLLSCAGQGSLLRVRPGLEATPEETSPQPPPCTEAPGLPPLGKGQSGWVGMWNLHKVKELALSQCFFMLSAADRL